MYHLVEIVHGLSITWISDLSLAQCAELSVINNYIADGMSLFVCELEV